MSLYLVTYALNRPGQDYQTVAELTKGLGTCYRFSDSVYLVKSVLDFQDFSQSATRYADPSDRIIIAKVDGKINGLLSDEQWDWINSNLY